MKTTIETQFGTVTVTVSVENEKIIIDAETPNVTVNVKNCGIPGIIGKDIDINVKEVVKDILDKALKSATSDNNPMAATKKQQTSCIHTRHCCLVCGCKYGEDDCPVVIGQKKGDFTCKHDWN